jgi:capsid assembly protease
MTRSAFYFAAGVPWLITEDGLAQILAVAAREDLDMAAVDRAVKARAAAPQAIALRGATRLSGTVTVGVRDRVAVVPIIGPVFRYSNLMTQISGATSLQLLARDFQTAADSSEISAIVLSIDSPGGQASGIAELAGVIRAARSRKPITAYVGDLAASAAYWLATAAEEIVLSPTGIVGSIGAVIQVSDTTTRDAAAGVRRSAIVSATSPRKALDP